MIAFLRGVVRQVEEDHLVLEVGGVGYHLFASTSTLSQLLRADGETMLWTHLQVREDALTLYGFHTLEERAMFQELLTIAGIGPKLALGILSALPANHLRDALGRGDVVMLTSLPGIGKKTARRLILELGERPGWTASVAPNDAVGEGPGQAVEALVSLGYNRAEALWAVEEAGKEGGDDTAALLRASLRRLAGR